MPHQSSSDAEKLSACCYASSKVGDQLHELKSSHQRLANIDESAEALGVRLLRQLLSHG